MFAYSLVSHYFSGSGAGAVGGKSPAYDPDFGKLFKVDVDFDHQMILLRNRRKSAFLHR
jgi:hypothetical protein